MSMMTLLDLADRCEAADAPKLLELNALNGDILRALGWSSDGRDAFDPQGNRATAIPNLVSSVDGARLIWDGWDHCEVYKPDHQTLGWTAHLYSNANVWQGSTDGYAATEALAWTAASLRARHALALSKGSDV